MIDSRSVEGVVRSGLCTGCGTCVSICPKGAVFMEETPGGLLFAKIRSEDCITCGLCLRVCGGSHLDLGLIPEDVDPFRGEVFAAFCGYAADSTIRSGGQSGGVVTALLSFLLEAGYINRALVTQMPENGSLRPVSLLARNKEEISGAQGSQYCPVAVNAIIPKDVGRNGSKIAVVGLPCHSHGLRNAQQVKANWKGGVFFVIGLFCDRTLSYGAINHLAKRGMVAKKDIITFRYRDKSQGGWPGTVCIRTKDNRQYRLSSSERTKIKEYFTPLRCRLCFDKMNILSDVSVGDAWGVREDKEGYSVLIARTAKGLELLEEAARRGILCLDRIDPEKIFQGQGLENRRGQWGAFASLRKRSKEPMPDCHICDNYLSQDLKSFEEEALAHLSWSNKLISAKSLNVIEKEIIKHEIILFSKTFLSQRVPPKIKKIIKILILYIKRGLRD